MQTVTPHRYPWPALLTAFAGVFMAIMDVFIVLVAAPAIQTDLHASAAGLQFMLAGYQLAYAMTLVTGGRLGDRYGRRRIFLVGMAVFTLASAGCGMAPSVPVLVAARLVQGVGAALLFPQAFSLIQALVPAPNRDRAFGVLGVVIGLSTIAGQLLGGVLIQADLAGLSWRPVFLVNLPIGVAALLCAPRLVPESAGVRGRRLDVRGAAVLAIALGLVVVPLVAGRQAGWPLWSWVCLALVVPVGAAFVALQRHIAAGGGEPLVELALVRQRPFAVALCLVLTWYAGLNSFFMVPSLTLQDGLGFGALAAGLAYAPLALCFLLTSALSGRLARRWGLGALALGAGLTCLGFASTAVVAAVAGTRLSGWLIVLTLLPQGLGMGLFQSPLLHLVLARVRPRHVGTASGLLATAQQVGGSIGVALIGLLFFAALPGGYPHALAVGVLFNVVVALACLGMLSRLSGSGESTESGGASGAKGVGARS